MAFRRQALSASAIWFIVIFIASCVAQVRPRYFSGQLPQTLIRARRTIVLTARGKDDVTTHFPLFAVLRSSCAAVASAGAWACISAATKACRLHDRLFAAGGRAADAEAETLRLQIPVRKYLIFNQSISFNLTISDHEVPYSLFRL